MRGTVSFQLVDEAVLSPYYCCVCHTQQGPFVDLQKDVDGGDWAYLCGTCAGTAAGLFGWAGPDVIREALGELERLREENERLGVRVSELLDSQAPVVPLGEVLAELQRRKGGRPAKTEALT